MQETLIFLTGCINPGGMSLTKIQDPYIRKKQYVDAINFYLKKTNLPILFVENSGTNISEIFKEQIELNRIEILTFNGNEFDQSLGKGYGEMLIIEYALENSIFMKTAEVIYKITGRYKVLNIKMFLKEFNNNPPNLVIDISRQLTFADSKFFLCKASFYKDIFLKYKTVVNDHSGIWFEHILCKAALEAILDNYTYSVFKFKPRYSGVTGSENIKLDNIWLIWYIKNIRHRIRYYLSQVM